MKTIITLLTLLSGFFSFSQLYKIPVDHVTSLQEAHPKLEVFKAIDNDPDTYYHSRKDQNGSPDELIFYFTGIHSIKKIVCTPAPVPYGRWMLLDVYYSTQSDPNTFKMIDENLRWPLNFDDTEINLDDAIQEPYAIKFSIKQAWMNYSTCAEMRFYTEDMTLFVPAVTKTYGDADYFPGNGSPSGISIASYTSSNTAVATITGYKVHIVGAGTTSIIANLVDGTTAEQILTVKQAELKVTADDKMKYRGEENPELTVSYSGFVNDDTADSLTKIPTIATTAITSSEIGHYPITVHEGVSDHYNFTYVEGTLFIEATLGTADFHKTSFTHYPNPVKHLWHVTSDKEITHIKVLNTLGQTVAEKAPHSTRGSIDLSRFVPGVYFTKVTTANGSKTIKVIKK